jgi:SAM-dependent methyltransferase
MNGPNTSEQAAGNTCEICGKYSAVRRELNDGYYARYCPGCDFLWTDTDRSPGALAEINKGQYEVKGRLLTYFLRQREFSRRYEKILGLLRRHAGGGMETLLEIGSNIGAFAGFASEHGIRVETVEIHDDLRAMQSILFRVPAYKSVEEIPPGRRYDVIVMMDVLEHLPQPVSFLESLKRFLAPDGLIYLQFPNKNALVAGISGKRWGWWLAPDHLYHFSENAIRRVANRVGMETAHLRVTSPLLYDVAGIPALGAIFRPLVALNRWIDLSCYVYWRSGSLIEAILKPARNKP